MSISPELEKEFEDLAMAYAEEVAKECKTHKCVLDCAATRGLVTDRP